MGRRKKTKNNEDEFKKLEGEIDSLYSSKSGKLTAAAESLLKDGE